MALLIVSGLMMTALLASTRLGTTPDAAGRPLAPDFSSFWTAAGLAADGVPAAVWSPPLHKRAQQESFPVHEGYTPDYYAFLYPPPFLLLILPLGLLPYGLAVCVWLATLGTAYLAAIRALLPPTPWRWLAVLAYPAFALNAENGQNGALSAALLGAAAVSLGRQPGLAGLCLGALCFKPQLALLVVPMLVAGRRWRALLWAGGMVATLCGISLAVFGSGAWRAFLHTNAFAGTVLIAGLANYGKMASPFAGLRLLGASVWFASWAQLIVSGAVIVAAWHLTRRRTDAQAEVALLAAGSCLVTPFLLDYDLLVLAVPLAWLAAKAQRNGWMPWEKAAAAMAFFLPLLHRPVGLTAGVPLAPLAVAALFAAVLRRALLTAPVESQRAASAHLGYA